jgi:hypothetical protein
MKLISADFSNLNWPETRTARKTHFTIIFDKLLQICSIQNVIQFWEKAVS